MWSNFRTSAKAICQAVAAEKFRRVFVAHLRSSASTLPQIALAPAFERATGRHFAKRLSAMILGIGYIMVGFTERKQGLHDLLAGTLVRKS
jgi:uncharacterized RDD family membrane protein YckC